MEAWQLALILPISYVAIHSAKLSVHTSYLMNDISHSMRINIVSPPISFTESRWQQDSFCIVACGIRERCSRNGLELDLRILDSMWWVADGREFESHFYLYLLVDNIQTPCEISGSAWYEWYCRFTLRITLHQRASNIRPSLDHTWKAAITRTYLVELADMRSSFVPWSLTHHI